MSEQTAGATPRDSLTEGILDLLRRQPGMRASEVAAALEADRTLVNKALYGPLKGQVQQDREYRWSVVPSGGLPATARPGDQRKPAVEDDSGLLSRLCRYYLDALAHDDDVGPSVYADSSYRVGYCELPYLPMVEHAAIADDVAARLRREVDRLSNEARQRAPGLVPVVGYPVLARKTRQGFVLQPLFVYEVDHDSVQELKVADADFPLVNPSAIRSLTAADGPAVAAEALSLGTDLGMAEWGTGAEPDEMLLRLSQVRPEWPWVEAVSHWSLTSLASSDRASTTGPCFCTWRALRTPRGSKPNFSACVGNHSRAWPVPRSVCSSVPEPPRLIPKQRKAQKMCWRSFR